MSGYYAILFLLQVRTRKQQLFPLFYSPVVKLKLTRPTFLFLLFFPPRSNLFARCAMKSTFTGSRRGRRLTGTNCYQTRTTTSTGA